MVKLLPKWAEIVRRSMEQQRMLFVGAAGPDGRENISPNRMASLRVQETDRIGWTNLSGSSNQAVWPFLQTNRMTLMWCAFTRQAHQYC